MKTRLKLIWQPKDERSFGIWYVITKHHIQIGFNFWFYELFFHSVANDMWLKLCDGSKTKNPHYIDDKVYSGYFPR